MAGADPFAPAWDRLTDLVGDVRAINQPGTDEEYPNWRLPLAGPDRAPLSLEAVMAQRS